MLIYHQVKLGSWAEIDEFLPSVVLLIRPETVPSGVRYGTVLYFLNACIYLFIFALASSLGNSLSLFMSSERSLKWVDP